jgi:hypothetical protein
MTKGTATATGTVKGADSAGKSLPKAPVTPVTTVKDTRHTTYTALRSRQLRAGNVSA